MTVSANSTPSSVRSLRLCSTVRRKSSRLGGPAKRTPRLPPTRRSGTTKPPRPGTPPPTPRTGMTSRRARSDGAMCHRTAVRPRKKETQRAEALPFAACRWPLREKGIAANTSVVSYGLISCTLYIHVCLFDNCIEGSICIIAVGRKIQTILDAWFKGAVQ
jgi:hypothetical protein